MKLPPDLKLLLVYLLLCCCQLLRIMGDPVGFTGTDSFYYLEAAQNLLLGRGPVATPLPNSEVTDFSKPVYLTAWPIGYPALVAFFALLTGRSVFWASKIVNLLSLAGCMLVLRKFDRQKAWLLSLVFGIFTLLEVFAFTWSEGPFLCLQLLFCYLLYRQIQAKPVAHTALWLALIGSAAFLVKYIGLYTVPLLAVTSVWLFTKQRVAEAKQLLLAAVAIGVVVLAYFYLNYIFAGLWWGGDRVFNTGNTVYQFFSAVFRGALNELNLIRHYYFRGPFDKLFFVLYAVQIIWLGLLYWVLVRGRFELRFSGSDALPRFLWLMALAYLAALIGLRLLSPFDAFYYRLMAPASMFFYLGVLSFLLAPQRLAKSPKLEFHLALFLIFVLLFQLPKAWLISLLR